jgi:hypothetical protein
MAGQAASGKAASKKFCQQYPQPNRQQKGAPCSALISCLTKKILASYCNAAGGMTVQPQLPFCKLPQSQHKQVMGLLCICLHDTYASAVDPRKHPQPGALCSST